MSDTPSGSAGAPRRCVLLDRDGTIIVERHYVAEPDEVELLFNAARGMAAISRLGLRLVVVTNQSGVARGLIDPMALDRVHQRLRELLRAEGVELDGIYTCPHLPEAGCCCRKPRVGLVDQAVSQLGFCPRESFVIGDKPSDIALGRTLGACTLLVRTGYGLRTLAESPAAPAGPADHVVDDLWQASQVIANSL